MKEKKQWQKPALIVLVRRKPEEAVMKTCKTQLVHLAFLNNCTAYQGTPCPSVVGS